MVSITKKKKQEILTTFAGGLYENGNIHLEFNQNDLLCL